MKNPASNLLTESLELKIKNSFIFVSSQNHTNCFEKKETYLSHRLKCFTGKETTHKIHTKLHSGTE